MKPQIIDIPIIKQSTGTLAVVELDTVPFDIARTYYLFDVPSDATRGGHAHKELVQLMVAVSGSFDVVLDDGENRETITLNKPNKGLLVPTMTWREMENFSSGAVCLVLASLPYEEEDYIREYADFKSIVAG